MTCVSSENVICKHVLAVRTFYVDLSFMPTGVTAVSATATTTDASLTVDTSEIIASPMTVDPSQGCAGFQLDTGRAILVVLSGGVASDTEVIVTVAWVQSDGDEDARSCRVLVDE